MSSKIKKLKAFNLISFLPFGNVASEDESFTI